MVVGAKKMMIIWALGAVNFLYGQQATDFVITEMPLAVMSATDTLWVKWAGALRPSAAATGVPAPDSGFIYYSKDPGGFSLAGRSMITAYEPEANNRHISGSIPWQRGTGFIAARQSGMTQGIFYCIVALPRDGDTLFSNEFQIIIQSQQPVTMIGPKNVITDLTPKFRWDENPGVPYYHLILSDEAINLDSNGLKGLSIVWQAITPDNEIVYGTPDPSGTITAAPPPLSPGKDYTWVVLNNYGNHMAYTSATVYSIPNVFSISGEPLAVPRNIYPADGDSLDVSSNPAIEFQWSNIDPDANTYRVYVYVASDFEGVDAQLVMWEKEVSAGSFEDAGSVVMDARSVLTTNRYSWKVMAIDERGAATSGELSYFKYSSPQGTMVIYTKEYLASGDDVIETDVGLVEIDVEVLEGSLEAPLAFYTDTHGYLKRHRPVGTYRVTAVKSGYEPISRIIEIRPETADTVLFYMERPEATVFGRVVDEEGQGMNLARVIGISDRGDTLFCETESRGNFLFNCYAADWIIRIEKTGYTGSLPRQITIAPAESHDFGSVALTVNPLTVSGVVRNSAGVPIIGARVILFRDEEIVDEHPSTSQDGTFAFNVTTGNYRLTATKTGFVSFSKSYTISGSRQITITMAPNAAVISGIIYGRSWLGSIPKVGPITNAMVTFIPADTVSLDTLTTLTNAQYGDFRISLPKNTRYIMKASAVGFEPALSAAAFNTDSVPGDTMSLTLQALGLMVGRVRRSATGEAEGSVNISLLDTLLQIAATARSLRTGYFEVSGIPGGTYTVQAGADGLVLDSIIADGAAITELSVDAGRIFVGSATPDSFTVYLSPGDKNIRWYTGDNSAAAVKIMSPFQKTIRITDTLKNVGAGTYIITVDADDNTIIDLARHEFTLDASDMEYIDTVSLPLTHNPVSSVSMMDGRITLTLESGMDLDSAALFYADVNATSYRSQVIRNARPPYEFSIVPPRDGSNLKYYFKGHSGSDIYGYEKETFTTYVRPDTTRLTKYEVVPSSEEDTLEYPSSYSILFSFKGYYSSAYIPDTTVDGESITWRLFNAQGCALEGTGATGTTVKVLTGANKTTSPVILQVKINTTKTPLAEGLSQTDTVFFNVSGTRLDSIHVTRIDAGGRVTNTATSKAQFAATGKDVLGNSVTITPEWSLNPLTAGTISFDGIFKPAVNFIGQVRILADASDLQGEYNPQSSDSKNESGLNVRGILTLKSKPDTVSDGRALTIIFPDSAVAAGEIGQLYVVSPRLHNLREKGQGALFIIGAAYDLNETKGVPLTLGEQDSVTLIIAIPEELQEKVKGNPGAYYMGRWNESALLWDTLSNSVVDAGGQWVSCNTRGFSRYAIVNIKGGLSSTLEISPNPFSPHVKPRGTGTYKGTCIRFILDAREPELQYAWIRIYNLLNDLVYSVKVHNVMRLTEYTLWWDGKTTSRRQDINGYTTDLNEQAIQTSQMCRNGRYFVVLTARDQGGREKNYMKQVILVK